MKKLILPAVLIAAALVFVSCATKVALPKGTYKGYSTYRFFNPDVENLPVFADKTVEASKIIQDRLAERLNEAGLKQTGDNPELLVAHLLLVQDSAVSTTISDYYINSGSEILSAAHKHVSKQKFDRNFIAGTLVVDVIDIENQRLIYRDFATRDVVEGMSGEERVKYVNGAVDEAIAAFLK